MIDNPVFSRSRSNQSADNALRQPTDAHQQASVENKPRIAVTGMHQSKRPLCPSPAGVNPPADDGYLFVVDRDDDAGEIDNVDSSTAGSPTADTDVPSGLYCDAQAGVPPEPANTYSALQRTYGATMTLDEPVYVLPDTCASDAAIDDAQAGVPPEPTNVYSMLRRPHATMAADEAIYMLPDTGGSDAAIDQPIEDASNPRYTADEDTVNHADGSGNESDGAGCESKPGQSMGRDTPSQLRVTLEHTVKAMHGGVPSMGESPAMRQSAGELDATSSTRTPNMMYQSADEAVDRTADAAYGTLERTATPATEGLLEPMQYDPVGIDANMHMYAEVQYDQMSDDADACIMPAYACAHPDGLAEYAEVVPAARKLQRQDSMC